MIICYMDERFSLVITRADGSRGIRFLPLFVCVSVLPHDISKPDAARITKRDVEMFHDESIHLF